MVAHSALPAHSALRAVLANSALSTLLAHSALPLHSALCN